MKFHDIEIIPLPTKPEFSVAYHKKLIYVEDEDKFYFGKSAEFVDAGFNNPIASTAITSIVSLSQAEYDALGEKVSTTLYIIIG